MLPDAPFDAEDGEGEVEGGGGSEKRKKDFHEGAEAKCRSMKDNYHIIPGSSWGHATEPVMDEWKALLCDSWVSGAATEQRPPPPDCTGRPSEATDPLIAICAGSTTRGVLGPSVDTLALFRYLLPSIERTADCGFNYVTVIGYDEGDIFFDSEDGRRRVKDWFDRTIGKPAAKRGISIRLELVRVNNKIRKPGPVFTAITKEAYAMGASYFYRVNDDSEMVSPWARKFVDTLEQMGPPYGVVGPESGNANILVHDFTNRLHMDIFKGQYYPVELTDWYVDDWISTVYGNARTVRAKNCEVIHHTSAHGQRYKADLSKAHMLRQLIVQGTEKIERWISVRGAGPEASKEFADGQFDGGTAKREQSKDIRRR
ncbi:unnamed protein product [Discosporangium mesarthrocarpum]